MAGSDVMVYAMQERDFLALLSHQVLPFKVYNDMSFCSRTHPSQSFKYVLIRTLRNKQKLFASISAFISHIAESITNKKMDFNSTLALYRKVLYAYVPEYGLSINNFFTS